MYQIIPLRWIVVGVAWFATSIAFLITWNALPFELSTAGRGIVFSIDVLLLALTWKPVWRYLWKKIAFLNAWFPDLNGDYDVELRHNWPIQQRLLAAASGGDRPDSDDAGVGLPELAVAKLRATIDLGFYSVNVTMWDEKSDARASVIDHSRTLAMSLMRPSNGEPHRLIYVYQQKNRRERQATTDDNTFEGAAILRISPGNQNELTGEYWTNRAWHQGLSTAGTIWFKRRRS